MSPGSLPMKGIFWEKCNNMPIPVRITPKIIKAFPIVCIFARKGLSPQGIVPDALLLLVISFYL
jgi:hypothetical protein